MTRHTTPSEAVEPHPKSLSLSVYSSNWGREDQFDVSYMTRYTTPYEAAGTTPSRGSSNELVVEAAVEEGRGPPTPGIDTTASFRRSNIHVYTHTYRQTVSDEDEFTPTNDAVVVASINACHFGGQTSICQTSVRMNLPKTTRRRYRSIAMLSAL